MARTLLRAETQINNDFSGGTNYFLRADGSTPLEGELDLNANKIVGLADPTADSDAATKSYVDGIASGLDVKASVRVASAGQNHDLSVPSGTGFIDGVQLSDNDRILLKDQTTASENGIYLAVSASDPSTWVRASDADADAEVTAGLFTFVAEGETNASTGWVLTTADPIVVDTTDLSFSQFSDAGQVTAGDGLTKTGDSIDLVAADASLTVNPDSVAVNAGDGLIVLSGEAAGLHVQAEDASVAVGASGISVALDSGAGTIELTASGLKVADGSEGQFLIGQGFGSDTAFVGLSGDVASVLGDGTVALQPSILREADYVVREAFSGDGNTTDFTLANTPVLGSEMAFMNGMLQAEGASDDYTITGDTISFASAPLSGDKIRVTYFHNSVGGGAQGMVAA